MEILKIMIYLLGIKMTYKKDEKGLEACKEYNYSMNLYNDKKYLEAYCYVLSLVDPENYIIMLNPKSSKIFRRIKEFKEKIYTPKEIANIVAKEFKNEEKI